MPRLPLRTRRRPGAAFKLSVEPLEERALPTAWHFDFGTDTSPAAPGSTNVPVLVYNPALGRQTGARGSGRVTRSLRRERRRTASPAAL